MSDFLVKSLPKYYRLDLSEKLSAAIKQGRSLNLIGLPAVGKYTYLNFFLENRKHFIDNNDIDFVIINTREFTGKNIEDFKNFIAKKLPQPPVNENSPADELIKKASSEKEIYLIFRFFEEMNSNLLDEIWRYLLLIRQLPYKYRFIFVSNRPLSEKAKDKVISSRLFGTEEFFRPTSKKDYTLEINEYEKFLGLSVNFDAREKLYQLTGGHGGYSKLVFEHQKEKLLKYLESDLYEIVSEKGELTNELYKRSEEILKVFTQEELEVISKIARNEKVELPKLFYDLGLVTENKIFSLILATFLQSH